MKRRGRAVCRDRHSRREGGREGRLSCKYVLHSQRQCYAIRRDHKSRANCQLNTHLLSAPIPLPPPLPTPTSAPSLDTCQALVAISCKLPSKEAAANALSAPSPQNAS